MAKHLEFRGDFDFAAPEVVFKLLYEDDAFTKFYHKEVNHDQDASASSWTEVDGGTRREVTFKPDISNIPAFLLPFLGSDVARMTEIQQYEREGDGFIIHSKLTTSLFFGTTLITTGESILSTAEKGCALSAKLTLELQTSLWFLREKVFDFVEKEAKASFKRWLGLAKVFCEKKMGIEVEEEDIFVDAEDLEEEEEVALSTGLDAHTIDRPPSSSSLRHPSNRWQRWYVQLLWKCLCVIAWHYEKFKRIERELVLLRSSSWFYVKAWTACGLGFAAGLTLGLLYRRHLKMNQ